MTGHAYPHGPLWSVVAALLCGAACRATPSALAPSNTVVAETPTGAVPMLPLGTIQRSGNTFDIAFEPGTSGQGTWVDLLRASRVLAVLVNLPEKSVREMRVWLWRGATPIRPTDWIDITGDVTALGSGRGYQMAFRDFSDEPALKRWARGDDTGQPVTITVHRHDNGFAIGLAPQRSVGTPFRVGVGAAGSTLYAIRFGR